MEEYIKREDLLERIGAAPILRKGVPYQVWDGVLYLVRKQPAADVVPVVRCLVCRHYDEPYCMLCKEKIGTSHRSQDMAYRKPNDFCSYGKTKKETLNEDS